MLDNAYQICYNQSDQIERSEKVARLTINISDKLDEAMRAYIEENKLTITIFIHMAIQKFLESQENTKKWQEFFTQIIKAEVNKMK